MVNEEVAIRFSKQQINSRSKTVEWNGHNLWCNGRIIYSYGSHFPVARFLGEHPKWGRTFVKNSDKYSNSTSCHQSTVARYCKGPSLSRSALNDLEILDFEELELKNILLWRQPSYKHLYFDSQDNVYYQDYTVENAESNYDNEYTRFIHYHNEWKLPRFGQFKPYRGQKANRFKQGMFTIEEIVVLELKNKCFLCWNGHVMALARKPKNISESQRLIIRR